MKSLANELKKMDTYVGIEYAQRMIELYKEFPNEESIIDKYIENRVYAVAVSADEAIAKGKRCLEMLKATRQAGNPARIEYEFA